jgi:hypothetical protein
MVHAQSREDLAITKAMMSRTVAARRWQRFHGGSTARAHLPLPLQWNHGHGNSQQSPARPPSIHPLPAAPTRSADQCHPPTLKSTKIANDWLDVTCPQAKGQ